MTTPPGPTHRGSVHDEAVALALTLADADARWGDYRAAVHALDVVEEIEGELPEPYADRRRLWEAHCRARED